MGKEDGWEEARPTMLVMLSKSGSVDSERELVNRLLEGLPVPGRSSEFL